VKQNIPTTVEKNTFEKLQDFDPENKLKLLKNIFRQFRNEEPAEAQQKTRLYIERQLANSVRSPEELAIFEAVLTLNAGHFYQVLSGESLVAEQAEAEKQIRDTAKQKPEELDLTTFLNKLKTQYEQSMKSSDSDEDFFKFGIVEELLEQDSLRQNRFLYKPELYNLYVYLDEESRQEGGEKLDAVQKILQKLASLNLM
jgi:hypothetical protein